jgi:hypothetical protein
MGEPLVATAVCAAAVQGCLNDHTRPPLGMDESLVATAVCAATVRES